MEAPVRGLPRPQFDCSIEGDYTLANISKEEPYEASYIWAVFHISDNVLINSMEVLFKNIAPDGITATCISNGETSLAVAVNYTRGCRRDSG